MHKHCRVGHPQENASLFEIFGIFGKKKQSYNIIARKISKLMSLEIKHKNLTAVHDVKKVQILMSVVDICNTW